MFAHITTEQMPIITSSRRHYKCHQCFPRPHKITVDIEVRDAYQIYTSMQKAAPKIQR